MKNPDAANHRKGNGRQVSFLISKHHKENYTDWMKHRVDSDNGKQIYSHHMSVVEPVFGIGGMHKALVIELLLTLRHDYHLPPTLYFLFYPK